MGPINVLLGDPDPPSCWHIIFEIFMVEDTSFIYFQNRHIDIT